MGRHTKQCPIPEIRVDTLVRYDTIRPDPVKTEIIRYVTRTDSIPYYIPGDTVLVYVPIPVECIEYRDSSYYAVVEGYKARLAYIETYNKTVFIDRIETHTLKTNPQWGIGVQVGYGTDFKRLTPYVGVGLQYNLFTW